MLWLNENLQNYQHYVKHELPSLSLIPIEALPIQQRPGGSNHVREIFERDQSSDCNHVCLVLKIEQIPRKSRTGHHCRRGMIMIEVDADTPS